MKKLFLFLFFLPLFAHAESSSLVGGDRDAHGCIASAGYTWSEALSACIRPWELYSVDVEAIDTGDTRLDQILARRASRVETEFRHDAEEMIREMPDMASGSLMLDIGYELLQTGSIISVRMDVYTYLGGAHGLGTSSSYMYDTQTNRLLPVVKFITRTDLREIAGNIEEYLITHENERFSDRAWLREGLSPKKLSNYTVFSAETNIHKYAKTITFYFGDYQLGPHSSGQPAVTIDVDTLAVLRVE